MEDIPKRRNFRTRDGGRFRAPRFTQEWFYGPYQSLTSEQICLNDPAWLSTAISQEIINGNTNYYQSLLQELAEINPEFSITLEAKRVIAERHAKWEAQMVLEKVERERIENIMAQRELIYNAMSKEAKAAHMAERTKLIGWLFKPDDVQLEAGKYKGFTPVEILERYSEDVMEDFSKAIIDHYYFPNESDIDWIKHHCPSFRLSDEAAVIYQYEMDALEEQIAIQEHLDYLACVENQGEIMDYFGEPSEGSSEDYNDKLDLDQQHPDFYQG